MNAWWKYTALFAASGLLTGLSLVLPYGFVLAAFGLALLLYLLMSCTSSRSAFLGALLSGTLHMLVVLSWGFSLEPLTALGLSKVVQTVFLVFVLGTSAFIIALGVALALAVLHFVTVGQDRWRLWLFPAALLVGELIGRMFFSLYTVGPTGGLAPTFGFGHMGFALASHGLLIFGAMFGGVYALTLLVALLAVLVVHFWGSRNRILLGLLVLIVTAFIRMSIEVPPEVAEVGLVETTVALDRRLRTLKSDAPLYEHIVSHAVSKGLSTIILPEDARYVAQSNAHAILMSQSIAILDNGRIDGENGAVLRGQLVHNGMVHELGEKQYVVSFGEYVPLFHAWLFTKLGFSEVVAVMQQEYGYKIGEQLRVRVDGMPVMLFCYESVVPYALQHLVQGRSVPYVAHVVSHAWFRDGAGLLKAELRSMLRVQAVQHGVYILQSANLAPAAVYTPRGVVYEAKRTSENWQVYRVGDIISSSDSLVY